MSLAKPSFPMGRPHARRTWKTSTWELRPKYAGLYYASGNPGVMFWRSGGIPPHPPMTSDDWRDAPGKRVMHETP